MQASGNGCLPCSLTSHLGNLVFLIVFNMFFYVVSSKPNATKSTKHCSASHVSQYFKIAPTSIHRVNGIWMFNTNIASFSRRYNSKYLKILGQIHSFTYLPEFTFVFCTV